MFFCFSKALSSLRQKIKKYNRDFEEKINEYKAVSFLLDLLQNEDYDKAIMEFLML